MSSGRQTEFDAATALEPLGDGAYDARMDHGWWVGRGPNGGYVAAVLLRALTEAVADPGRPPRSLTVHYTAPPAEGPVRIDTRVERTGRSLTTVSARMTQGGRLLALALGAFSAPRPDGHDFVDAAPPEAGAPGDGRASRAPDERLPPIARRWELRATIGGRPFSGGGEAVTGGWLRLADPRHADALVVTAMTDAWFPLH